MGQQWSPAASGGYLANPSLSAKVRNAGQPMSRFRQFVRKEPGFGKGKSDTLLFDRIANVTTGGGTITELQNMPEDSYVISQGSLVVTEYGNSVPWTQKLDALAALDVNNITTKALKNDMVKTLDRACGALFRAAPLSYIPTGTTGTPTATFQTTVATAATCDVQTFDVRRIVDKLKKSFVTPYDGENFICICSIDFAGKIKEDTNGAGWVEAAKFGDPDRLFAGEIGRYYGCRFIEESNLLSNTLGTQTYSGEAVFFGEDPVIEGVVIPEELRAKIPTDFGRDMGLAWYFLGGWAATYTTSVAGELKTIRVWST